MTMVEHVGEIGEYYPAETFAKTAILFNRFVARGDDIEDIIYADSSHEAIGVAEYDYRQYNKDLSVRTGWEAGEPIPVKGNGFAFITAGELLAKDDWVMPGAYGVASKYADPTIASTPTEANIEAVEAIPYTKKGKVIKGAAQGELVKIQIYNCL